MGKKAADKAVGRAAVKSYLQQYHMAMRKKKILEERHAVLSSELRAPRTVPCLSFIGSRRSKAGSRNSARKWQRPFCP